MQALYRSKLDLGLSTSTVLSIHTVASGALKQQATRWGMVLQTEGARGKEVQEMLGHSSIGQTMDTYTDLIPTIQEQAAKRLDSALFG